MRNIIWKQTDGSQAITTLVDDNPDTSEQEAIKLQLRGDVPSDWTVIAYDQPE